MVQLIRQSRKKNSNCFISIIISNKSNAKGIEYARSMNVDTLVIPSYKKTREEFEIEVSKVKKNYCFFNSIYFYFRNLKRVKLS